MLQVIAILALIVKLLPVLVEAIKQVEKLFPEKGKGQVKLAMVKAAVESAYAVGSEGLPVFEKAWPNIETTIQGIVKGFNALGVFKK